MIATTGGAHSVRKLTSRGGCGAASVATWRGQGRGGISTSPRASGAYHDASLLLARWLPVGVFPVPMAPPCFCPEGRLGAGLSPVPPPRLFLFPGVGSGAAICAVLTSPVSPVGLSVVFAAWWWVPSLGAPEDNPPLHPRRPLGSAWVRDRPVGFDAGWRLSSSLF